MTLDLTDEEIDALARLLSQTIDDDRYPLSARVQLLKAILDKFRPEPFRAPLPPLKALRAAPRYSSQKAARRTLGEIRAGTAGHPRQLGCRRRSPHRMVPGLPAPSTTRSSRTGSALWRRDDGARLARAADLLQMRQPAHRYSGDRNGAAPRVKGAPTPPLVNRSAGVVTPMMPRAVIVARKRLWRDEARSVRAASERKPFAPICPWPSLRRWFAIEGLQLHRVRHRRAAQRDPSCSLDKPRWFCRLKGRDAHAGTLALPHGIVVLSPRAGLKRLRCAAKHGQHPEQARWKFGTDAAVAHSATANNTHQ